MNIVANWSYPTAVKLGRGRIKELAEACKTLGIRKPLLADGSRPCQYGDHRACA